MSLVPTAQPRRRRRRIALPAEAVAVLCGIAAFLVQLAAGWPGWLTTDSIAMWTQAQAGVFTDWYPPMLTWAWSVLDVQDSGPLIPFLLQLELFWAGVTLLTIGLQPAARWTRFIPLLVLINPVVWLVVTVWRDAAAVSVTTLGIGVAALAVRAVRAGRRNGAIAALWCGAVIIGLATAGRGYLLPLGILLMVALTVALLPRSFGRRARLEAGATAVVLTALSAMMVAVSLPAVLIGEVTQTRANEAFYALDAYHIDCAPFWATGAQTAVPVSPPELWADGKAPCEGGVPGAFGASWTGVSDPTGEPVLTFTDWFGLLLDNPAVVIGGRLQHVASLLSAEFTWAPDVTGPLVLSAPGAGGAGETAGQENRGGIALAAHSAVTSFVPSQLYLWILVVPIGAALWYRRRRGDPAGGGRTVIPLLLWPFAAASTAGVLATSNDVFFLAPAALLGWVLSLWVIGLRAVPSAEDLAAPQGRSRRIPHPVRRYPAPVLIEPVKPSRSAGPVPSKRSARPRLPLPTRHHVQPDLGPTPLAAFVAEHAQEASEVPEPSQEYADA